MLRHQLVIRVVPDGRGGARRASHKPHVNLWRISGRLPRAGTWPGP